MSAEPAYEADRLLIDAIREGDPTAYRGLVERYQGRVFALIYGMVRDKEEARDLTQDTFIKAYRNLERFRLESTFYTWLYRIAMNVAIDHIRKFKKRQTSEYDDNLGTRDQDGEVSTSHLRSNPHKDLDRKQISDRIFAALDQLSEEHRQVVILREVDGLSYKEIADTMDIPEGTVMSRLFYARRKLREILTAQGITG